MTDHTHPRPAAGSPVDCDVGRLEPERADDGAPSVEEARRMGEHGSEAVEGERLAFEAWMAGHCWALCATWTGRGYIGEGESVSEGRYVCRDAMATRRMWAAWRDRAALARLKTPNVTLNGRPEAKL